MVPSNGTYHMHSLDGDIIHGKLTCSHTGGLGARNLKIGEYGAHWLILLLSVRGTPYCDTRLLQLKQGAAGPPESLGKTAARISPAGTPRTNPGRARPGNAV